MPATDVLKVRQRDYDRLHERVLQAKADALNIETSIEQLIPADLLERIGADQPARRTLPLRVMRICDAVRDYAEQVEALERRLKWQTDHALVLEETVKGMTLSPSSD